MQQHSPFSRRKFLTSSASFLGLSLGAKEFTGTGLCSADDNVLDQLRNNLLELVNEEREVAKVQPVVIDDLATQVATKHARDMARHDYVSHWNHEGLKPYQRYSFAGGFHATQENISAADNTWSSQMRDLRQDTSYLHLRLYYETPPNDGHRRAILRPQQTHVGFGIAVDELRLRVVELFVAKHVELKSVPQKAKPGASFNLSGKILNRNHILVSVEVFYEPLPKEPELNWLRQPRSYSLPKESVVLRPVLPKPFFYADGKPGVVKVEPDGRFTAPIRLFKRDPGVYTLVCWLERDRDEQVFSATELCIRAE